MMKNVDVIDYRYISNSIRQKEKARISMQSRSNSLLDGNVKSNVIRRHKRNDKKLQQHPGVEFREIMREAQKLGEPHLGKNERRLYRQQQFKELNIPMPNKKIPFKIMQGMIHKRIQREKRIRESNLTIATPSGSGYKPSNKRAIRRSQKTHTYSSASGKGAIRVNRELINQINKKK